MSTLEAAHKAAVDLVKLLETARGDADRTLASSRQFRTERDAATTKIADLEAAAVKAEKRIADLTEGLAACKAECDRLNLLLNPPAPVPVPDPKVAADARAAAAAQARKDERDEQKAEDARDDRAAVRASLHPPSRHK